jgi:hypothetical protein
MRISRTLFTAPAAALAIAVGLVAGPMAVSASADITLDQSNANYNLATGIFGDHPPALNFTAGLSGPLARVDLGLYTTASTITGPVTVAIHDVGPEGEPAATLATQSVPVSAIPTSSTGWATWDFADPAEVTAGTTYAIVVTLTEGDSVGWKYSSTGLLYQTWVDLPTIDADNDGVADADDLCAGTVLPDLVPQKVRSRYGANADGVFVTTTGESSGITIVETAGCSAAQIIAQTEGGNGLAKYGLSIGELNAWVDSVTMSTP